MPINTKERPLRVQGSRSHAGCLACKAKHVKCDERVPVCGRCLRTSKPCQYANYRSKTINTRFIVYSIPNACTPSPGSPPREQRGLWHFHHRTVSQIEGTFHSDLWSNYIPQLIQANEIVRDAALALSTLHEHYLDHSLTGTPPPEYALRCYEKARRQIIDLESPDDHFDTILCTCIMFSTLEGLRGEFKEATRHACAGMKIISAQEPSKSRSGSVFNTEEALPRVFMALQAHAMQANVSDFQLDYLADKQPGSVPDHFSTMEEAAIHFQLLSNQIFDLHRSAENHHEGLDWKPSEISPDLLAEYEAISANYDRFARALQRFETTMGYRGHRQQLAFELVKIFASSLEIDLHVFLHGESTYDDMTSQIFGTLHRVEKFLRLQSTGDGSVASNAGTAEATSARETPALFHAPPEVIPVLFEIATRTNNTALRQRAIDILRSTRRREGVWDSLVAARLAEQIIEMKQQGAALAETQHIGYKFLIADIILLSDRKCLVRHGFKRVQPGAFNSFWLETIQPGQGSLQSQILDISEEPE